MKTFSIIIPVYNGHDVIGRALDSIYSQGMSFEHFEVICIDDCSPTMDTFDALNNYTYNGKHPENLKILRHEVNKRQGAARNTGLMHAEGEWILYLDADDRFVENSLLKLQQDLDIHSECDCIMFDYQQIETQRNKIKRFVYSSQNLPSETHLSGEDFIQQYPVPWVPWAYAFKKNFLLKNNILFVENVRFEDTDYMIKCTLLANKMTFLPLETVAYIVNQESTTTIGNDVCKISNLFSLSQRIKILAENYMHKNKDAAMAAMYHHIFHYHTSLTHYLWRLSYRNITNILESYPPYPKSGDKLVNFAGNHPHIYAIIAQIVRPFLLSALWVKHKIKK